MTTPAAALILAAWSTAASSLDLSPWAASPAVPGNAMGSEAVARPTASPPARPVALYWAAPIAAPACTTGRCPR
jgi:hypothetical protein